VAKQRKVGPTDLDRFCERDALDKHWVGTMMEEAVEIGGTSWYPGHQQGPLIGVVSVGYRDCARAAFAAPERFRASQTSSYHESPLRFEGEVHQDWSVGSGDHIQRGSRIVYRPPGDRRTDPCRALKREGSRAYLKPLPVACTEWVLVETLLPSSSTVGLHHA
jgi:hypothetical protein